MEIPSGCSAGGIWAHSFPDPILLQSPSPFGLTGAIDPVEKPKRENLSTSHWKDQNGSAEPILRNLCG